MSSDVWTLEASEERLKHIHKLIEQYTGNSRWAQVAMTSHVEAWHVSKDEFSGMCYSPDLSKMFTWSTDGETWASDDEGATWILQEGATTETDEGAFVAGREPSFVPWFSSPLHTFELTHRVNADITLSEWGAQ